MHEENNTCPVDRTFYLVVTVNEEDSFSIGDVEEVFSNVGTAEEYAEKQIYEDGHSRLVVQGSPLFTIETRAVKTVIHGAAVPSDGGKSPPKPKVVIKD